MDVCALAEPIDPSTNLPKQPRAVSGQTDAPVELQVWPPPADGRHQLTAGVYELLLAVSARDTDASFYRLKVEHDGKWWDADDLKEHLGVELEKVSHKP